MEKVDWTELEGFMKSKAVGATPKELVWIEQCWSALEEANLTAYNTEQAQAQVLLRACILLEILDEYKSLALDTELHVDAIELWQLLRRLQVCGGHATIEAEWPVVVAALETHYGYALESDMECMLPLLRDSIKEHYKHPMIVPTAVPEEYEGMDLDDFIEMGLEERVEEIYAWYQRGMRI